MKAILVKEPFHVEIADVPKPVIRKGDDVIVRITSGGICGSDIGIWNGTNSLATYPRLIGHEFGGIVEEVGADVTSVKPGDKVAVDPVVSCGECYACKIGRHNVCRTVEVMGVHRDGGFAEFVKADEKNIHKFNVDFDESLLGLVEPYSIGMQVNNRGQINADDKVLVMGAGPVGMCIMQVAKQRGAQVIMSDIVKERLSKALEMGADEVVLVPDENLEERLLAFTDGEGIPVIADTVCTSDSFKQAVELVCPAGRVICLSLKTQPCSNTLAEITKKEVTIYGSRLNKYCFDQVIEGFESGSLQPELLKTKEFSFQDVEKAFETIRERPQDVLKIVLKF